jgi:hypothetical protein
LWLLVAVVGQGIILGRVLVIVAAVAAAVL